MWNNNRVQFARLLAEIKAVGLNKRQMSDLCASMNLTPARVNELFDRAENEFEAAKALPACVRDMGTCCAAHARGAKATEACNATE